MSDCTLKATTAPLNYWSSSTDPESIWGVFTKSPGDSPCLADTFLPAADDSAICPQGTCKDFHSSYDSWTCDDGAAAYDHSCDFLRLYADCRKCGGCECTQKHDEQLQGVPYSMRDYVGNCNLHGMKDLKNITECELAAQILGLSDTSAHNMPIGYSRYPYGCYFKPLNGNLYWNSYGNFEVEFSARYNLCYFANYVVDNPGSLDYYGPQFAAFRGPNAD